MGGAPCCKTCRKKDAGRGDGRGGTNKIVWSQWLVVVVAFGAGVEMGPTGGGRNAPSPLLKLFFFLWGLSASEEAAAKKPGGSAFSACLLPHGLQVAFKRRADIIRRAGRGGGVSL